MSKNKGNKTLATYKESDTTFDNVFAFFTAAKEIKLSSKEEYIKDRWLGYWQLERQWKSPSQALKLHMRLNKDENGKELSIAQAYRDRRNAYKIFGNLNQADKQARKILLYEYAFDLMVLAKQKGEFNNANAAWQNMFKVSDVNKEEDLLHNPEKLEDREDKYYLDPAMKESMMQFLLQNGSIDFNNLQTEDAQILEDDE